VVARPSYAQRERWADAAHGLGGLRSFSDRVAELDDWGLTTVRKLLADGGSRGVLPQEQVRAAARLAQAEGVA
jgi:alpha-galactosidase